VYEDCSREDENDVNSYALVNDSHDVIKRDVRGDVRNDAADDRMMKFSAPVQDAVPAHRPGAAQDDEVYALSDAVRRVSTAPRGGSQVSPSPAPAGPPMSASSSPSPSHQQRYTSRPAVPRSPDSERWRCRPRRPDSSPSSVSTRRVSCGDRVDSSVDASGIRTTSACSSRRAPVSRANTTGEYLLQVPDVVYRPPAPALTSASPISVPTAAAILSSDLLDDAMQLSSSLPERWQIQPAVPPRPTQTKHAPRVYYSHSEDRVSATDAETRAIVPSLPYSTCASPGGSPRLRRQPTIETRRLSVTETDEGWTQLNQYKLKDEIGKVCNQSKSSVRSCIAAFSMGHGENMASVAQGSRLLCFYTLAILVLISLCFFVFPYVTDGQTDEQDR